MVSARGEGAAPVNVGCSVVADSRPAWLRWWHRKTIRPGSFEGHFILRTRVHMSWLDWWLLLFGRTLVVEYRSAVEPDYSHENTTKVFDSMQASVWTTPRRD